MPDVHVERHGDRWSVRLEGDDAPVFESYTREEAEAEGRRRADGGEVHVSAAEIRVTDDAAGGAVAAEADPERPDADREVDVRKPEDQRPGGESARPGEEFREPQAGL
jgi:hypothetical protein